MPHHWCDEFGSFYELSSLDKLQWFWSHINSSTVDAAYEGMQKRTFLVTIVLAFIHIPFIIEVIVLYSKLGPKTKEDKTEQNTKQDKYKYTKLEPESPSD